MTKSQTLMTRRGPIEFPAYIPVTTFGDRYPLDRLIAPYLPRLAPAVMVSYHYARQMVEPPRIPMMVDSGGFASLFDRASIKTVDGLGIIELESDTGTNRIEPSAVLELQEEIADVAFTLDFPIPPRMAPAEARKRLELTIANAHWALANRRRRDLPLYACVQAWDSKSARECARAYRDAAFDGIAIGGLVPRVRDMKFVLEIVEAVRSEVGDLPLHVFGLGKPGVVARLYSAGVDSVDSSSYVKLAADGRLWADSGFHLPDASPTERLHLALCNLAYATGRPLPLSMPRMRFSTALLCQHRNAAVEESKPDHKPSKPGSWYRRRCRTPAATKVTDEPYSVSSPSIQAL